MTVTPDHARMLTELARACRPHGARRWDTAGVMAAIKAISTWSLAEAMVEVATAAADRDAQTPAVIGKQGRRWQANVTVEPTYRANEAWCTVCGRQRHNHGGGHEFDPPLPADAKLTPEATARTVAALKDLVPPTKPPEPRKTLDELIDRNPRLRERVDAVRANLPGVTTAPDLTSEEAT